MRSVAPSPNGKLVALDDAAGAALFSVDAELGIQPVPGSPFADPSACEPSGLAWSPQSKLLFVGHRACAPAIVTVYAVADDGTATAVGAFASGAGSEAGAVSLAVDPTGAFLFVGHESGSVGVLSIAQDGTLAPIGGSPFAVPAGAPVRALALH